MIPTSSFIFDPTRKPPRGVVPNRLHPLCPRNAWLFNEGAGITVFDCINARENLTTGAFEQAKHGCQVAHTSTAHLTTLGPNSVMCPLTEATFVIGHQKRDATLRNASGFGINSVGADRVSVALPWGAGQIIFDWGGTAEGTSRLTSGVLTYGDNVWALTTGPRGMEIWQDGLLVASNSGNTARTISELSFGIGDYAGIGGDLANWRFFYVYWRQLSPARIRDISRSPFSFFQPTARPPRYFLSEYYGEDIAVQWHPTSRVMGLGRSALGYEAGGIGGEIPPDLVHTIVEVIDRSTGDIVRTSEPIQPTERSWTYTADMNEQDHDGVTATYLTLRIVQIGKGGKRCEIPASALLS